MLAFISAEEQAMVVSLDKCSSSLCLAAIVSVSAGLCAATVSGDRDAPRHGLATVWARRPRLGQKSMEGLSQDGHCQTERLIFHDEEIGAEVWRLTFGPSMNFIHSHINRSPWNGDGSMLLVQSDRGMPGVWKRKETGRGDPHFFVMAPDGSSFRMIRPRVPEGKWGTGLRGRHVVWDRFDHRRTYWVTHRALYAVDIAVEELGISKIVDLPNPERRKSIFSFPSENNVLMLKDLNSRAYDGELYFIDLRKKPDEDGFFFHYPWQFKVEHAKHRLEMEFGFHDIYFRRTPDDSYVFNFGSAGSVGEALFFEAPLRRVATTIKVCYPDDGLGIPYYSHPAWSHDGRLVSYFGLEKPGKEELNPGWHVRDHDAKKDLARLIPGWVGGHIAWDGYDDEWVCAAVSSKRFVPEWHGWLAHAHIPSGKAAKLVRHYSRLNGGKSNYAAIPRPAQSPDATKCLYHSTMLHTDDMTMDLYITDSHRPAPPLAVEIAAQPGRATISRQPPRIGREIKGYRVYRSERPQEGFSETSGGLVAETSFTDGPLDEGKAYYYFVTSEEHSGLESDATSSVVRLPGGDRFDPLKGWDRTAPAVIGDLRCERLSADRAKLTWTPSPSSDVRYYNIYYSAERAPESQQANRLISPSRLDTMYVDWGLDPGRPEHFYAITAVDRQGNESKPVRVELSQR